MLLWSWNLSVWNDMIGPNKGVTFKEIVKFLKECPEWPEQEKIIAKGEKYIDEKTDPKVALEWFRKYPPQSIQAWHLFIKLLPREEKVSVISQVWQTKVMTLEEQKEWFKLYKKFLNQKDFQRRLDFLYTQEATSAINAMLEYIPSLKDQVDFRHRLEAKESGLSLPKNPSRGMVLRYIKYLRLQDDFDGCAEILKKFKKDQNTFANEWVYERLRLSKELIQQKRYKEAYHVLDGCSLRTSPLKNDILVFKVEVGYYLLDYRDKLVPDLIELYENGTLANTKSFGAYYLGIIKKDNEWLKKAAYHPTTFFGLKAIAALKEVSPPFIKPYPFTKKNDLINTLFNLDKTRPQEVIQFISAVVKRDIKSFDQGINFIEAIDKKFGPPFTFWADSFIQKKFGRTPKMRSLYPILPQVKDPLHLALIRQESLFDKDARSPADAMGYMQLIQKTAERFAERPVTEAEILDPKNNLKWGKAYLAQLHQDYNGCIPLILSAYNAGEHRVERWVTLYGNPQCDVPAEQFIALIPFKETKHYVMKILANHEIYKERLA